MKQISTADYFGICDHTETTRVTSNVMESTIRPTSLVAVRSTNRRHR